MRAMARKLVLLITLVVLSGFIASCDNGPPLENMTAREPATIKGTFYTESPDDLIFPVKVLFALDCSGSMGAAGVGSDPTNQRLAATMEFVERYNSNPNVSFEIMLWNQSVFRTTYVDGYPGFTKDAGDIQAVLSDVNNTGTTDYVGTIESIHEDIRRDIMNTDNYDSLARTKYIVIFFSDGLDNVPGSDQPRTNDILHGIDELYSMATEDYGIRNFSFHTFLLPGIDMTAQDRADCIDLMQKMSEHGHGQFRIFENADTIDFINIVDMRLTAEYQVKFVCAYNFNVVPGVDTLYADSDGDGLSDEQELHPSEYWWYPTDPNVADTDGDGFSDFFEYKISTVDNVHNPLVPDGACDALPDGTYPDSDWDGLNDCEEFYKGTNAFNPDTDHDGIPDSVEFYAGTNPLEDQTTLDTDFDGAVDWFEVQRHTNVRANDPTVRARYAYGYDITDRGFDPDLMIGDMAVNMRRYDFTISNISLMDTGGSMLNGVQQLAPGDNLIRVFIAQVPEDMPDQSPVYRVADVIFNYRTGTRSTYLYPADFQLLE
jgi:Bacterial TSP3 repeat